MASVSKCGSVRLVSDHSAFMGSGMEQRAVFLKPWSSSSQFRAMLVVEVISRTSSGFRIARHFSIRKKEVAKKIGETKEKSCVEKGITKVAFDGSIKAVAAAARQHGLQSYAFVSFWEI